MRTAWHGRPPDGAPPQGARAHEPMLNLPPAVQALIVANLAVAAVRFFLPQDIDIWVILSFGFIPARYTLEGGLGWQALVGPLTYQFLHGGALHLTVNMVTLAAFGSGIERAIGTVRMLILYFLAGFAGAAAELAVGPTNILPMIGASGAISGLFGAVLQLMRRRRRTIGGDRGILIVAAIWIGTAVLFGTQGLPGDGGSPIAWVAHIGGFVAGIALFPLLAPGAPRPRP